MRNYDSYDISDFIELSLDTGAEVSFNITPDGVSMDLFLPCRDCKDVLEMEALDEPVEGFEDAMEKILVALKAHGIAVYE
jgi:hypothetical protein